MSFCMRLNIRISSQSGVTCAFQHGFHCTGDAWAAETGARPRDNEEVVTGHQYITHAAASLSVDAIVQSGESHASTQLSLARPTIALHVRHCTVYTARRRNFSFKLSSISLPNINRLSIFFHRHILRKICNNMLIRYTTTF